MRRPVWLGMLAALVLVGCGQPAATNREAPAGGQPEIHSAVAQAETPGGGGLADGTYDCSDGQHLMGKVDIRGAAFRYRPDDAAGGAFAPYSVDADGAIHWGGAFPGIDAPPSHVTTSSRQAGGFNVNFQVTAGSYEDTMTCNGPGT